MKEQKYSVSPGTAGLAERISSKYADKLESESSRLYVVKPNRVMPCGQNQY